MSLVLSKLDKLDSKIDSTNDRLNSMDKTLVKQEENLKEHMRRTAILEEGLKPVQKHVTRVEGALKLLGVISVLVGIAAGVAKLLGQ